jgi:hypothetical protein
LSKNDKKWRKIVKNVPLFPNLVFKNGTQKWRKMAKNSQKTGKNGLF